MAELVRHIPPDTPRSASSHGEPAREWLVANGVGGYASGTVTGQATRRYHGLLIAALPVPLGRWLLLSHLSERVRLSDGHVAALGGALPGDGALVQARTTFRMEQGLPVWEYALAGVRLEKRVLMAHTQNTTYVIYRLSHSLTRKTPGSGVLTGASCGRLCTAGSSFSRVDVPSSSR